MRKFILAGLVVFATISVFIACRKDNSASNNGNTIPTPKSVTDLLTGGSSRKWLLVSATANGNAISQEPCQADDLLIFNKQGDTYVMNYGTMLCDSSEATNETGTWFLSNNDKTLNLLGPDSGTVSIDSISDTRFVFTMVDTTEGLNTVFVARYKTVN